MDKFAVVFGGTGQVGQALSKQTWPKELKPVFPARTEVSLADRNSIYNYFNKLSRNIGVVINCAAYTAVDKAETEAGEAFLANAQGPAWLAETCRSFDLPIIHVSTDYVFDGSKTGFYKEYDSVSPLGAYGASKLAGEIAVSAANGRSIILRTAWVVSPFRSNFIKTMLRLGTEHSELRVVNDQIGCPTGAPDIARALIILAKRLASDPACPTGCFHFVNDGEATWYELANQVFKLSAARGYVAPMVLPITTLDYPTPAQRPANSRLSTERIQAEFGIKPRHWREVVTEIISDLLPMADQSQEF